MTIECKKADIKFIKKILNKNKIIYDERNFCGYYFITVYSDKYHIKQSNKIIIYLNKQKNADAFLKAINKKDIHIGSIKANKKNIITIEKSYVR